MNNYTKPFNVDKYKKFTQRKSSEGVEFKHKYDYRKKQEYRVYPNSLKEIEDAPENLLLGWYRFLKHPYTNHEYNMMCAIVQETKKRYCTHRVQKTTEQPESQEINGN
jgi:hypothetical protein